MVGPLPIGTQIREALASGRFDSGPPLGGDRPAYQSPRYYGVAIVERALSGDVHPRNGDSPEGQAGVRPATTPWRNWHTQRLVKESWYRPKTGMP